MISIEGYKGNKGLFTFQYGSTLILGFKTANASSFIFTFQYGSTLII